MKFLKNIITQIKLRGLKEIQQKLNNTSNINSGGCGVSALALHRWLTKIGVDKKDLSIVYLYDTFWRYDCNKNNIKNKSAVLTAPEHCCLYYKKQYFDSTGIININSFTYKQRFKTVSKLVKSINESNWNTLFDRDNVDRIAQQLKIIMKDVKI